MSHYRNIFAAAAAIVALGAFNGGALANTGQPILEATANVGGASAAPASQALRTALIAPNAASDEIRSHYEATAFRGLWFDATGDDARVNAFLAALEAADEHALPVGRYRIDLLKAAAAAARADAEAAAAAELAFTSAFLAYARDIRSGVLEPRTVDRDLHVFPERPVDSILLAGLSSASSPKTFIDGLAPRHPHYARLKSELAALTATSEGGDWLGAAPEGGSLRLGERGPRVEAIRERLAALGDYAPATPAVDPQYYDVSLETAVLAFQERHGLNADGVIGKRTIAMMNKSAAYRAGQVIVNMERLRWLNRDLGQRRIMVNQADFTVTVVDGGQILFHERVVVGKARKHRTPEFSDLMSYLVFNPVWHVPYSIASKEILPELQQDPTYLEQKNMRLLVRGEDGDHDATMTDWSLYSENDFPFIIKQRPGAGNALGRVKFMFPNQFNIYLHDTPSKRLFAKDARAFSHGCVRVQDPMELARVLLAPQASDPSVYIERKLDGGKERRVNLDEPVPVHLTYRTAWIDDEGRRQFRADIYGRDARVLAALRAAGVNAGPDS